jgi:hypothetical protein
MVSSAMTRRSTAPGVAARAFGRLERDVHRDDSEMHGDRELIGSPLRGRTYRGRAAPSNSWRPPTL